MRPGNLFSNRGSAVLHAPEPERAPREMRAAGFKRSAPVTEMPLRREAYDADDFADGGDERLRPRGGVKVRLRDRLIPSTLWGRIAAGCGVALAAGAVIAGGLAVRDFLAQDAHFTVASAKSIEIAGAGHLTHAQLLSLFGEDVERNIFSIPLEARRAQLERLPWVEHATVMRLLPDRVRVAIVERTPVAFVRQGAHIGLVDASGALFDLPSAEMEDVGGRGAVHYSFPVLTGIAAADPASMRAARMKLYMGFVAALDASGEKVSSKLSEVDVSNPEDVMAIVAERGGTGGGGDILVHFGDERFLERYHAFEQHLAEWRTQYPRLSAADMRYERQVVLEMRPDAAPAQGAVR